MWYKFLAGADFGHCCTHLVQGLCNKCFLACVPNISVNIDWSISIIVKSSIESINIRIDISRIQLDGVRSIYRALPSASINIDCNINISISTSISISNQARARSARARRTCALRALGLLLYSRILQWEGGRLFDRSFGFFYGNSCNSGTESRKIVPKVGN